MTTETIKVSFNPVVKKYTLFNIAIMLCHGMATIPLAILWMMGFGQWYSRINYEKMYCELTDKHIKFSSGAFFREINTMQLEKIQDITLLEGPLLKYFGINVLKIEAAGSRSEIKLVGVVDAEGFKQQIIDRQVELKRQEQLANNQQVQLLSNIKKLLIEISNNQK